MQFNQLKNDLLIEAGASVGLELQALSQMLPLLLSKVAHV